MNKTIEIEWMPFPTNELPTGWEESLWFDPEPVVKHIVKDRNTDVEYLKCPAFLDYYKNAFVFRSPIDFTITVENDVISLESNVVCIARQKTNSKFKTVVVDLQTLFIATEPLIIEQLPASMEPKLLEFRAIPGEFDISKWVRPITVSLELLSEKITIRRGDPLFYFRFRADQNKKIKLSRITETARIRDVATKCVLLKYQSPNNSMIENYTYALDNGLCPVKH